MNNNWLVRMFLLPLSNKIFQDNEWKSIKKASSQQTFFSFSTSTLLLLILLYLYLGNPTQLVFCVDAQVTPYYTNFKVKAKYNYLHFKSKWSGNRHIHWIWSQQPNENQFASLSLSILYFSVTNFFFLLFSFYPSTHFHSKEARS